jgi:Zn-dependent M28 family amino/carboxypeptidase
MKKLHLLVLALGFMCLVVYVSKTTKVSEIEKIENSPQKKFDTLENALEKITAASAKSCVEYLASEELEGRMSGKKGNVKAAEYIKNKFDDLGYETQYQKFKIRRLNYGPNNETGDEFTQNICAWSIGKDDLRKNEIVVVGAHMDHIGYGPKMSMAPNKIKIHPGADDNASGTAALLEIAKGFANMKNKRTILFIAFSAEEMGLLGSEFYVQNPILPANEQNIKKHIFMLNMDMVGYLNKGKTRVSFENQESSVNITKYIGELSNKYSFAKSITSRGSGGSDHASFYNKRIPVAFLHTGGHDFYHTPADTSDKLNYDGIEKISKYALELIWKVCEEEKIPVFNNSNFKQLPTDHDHGIKKFD